MDNVRRIAAEPPAADDDAGRPPSLDDAAEQFLAAAILDSPAGYLEAATVLDRADIEKPGYRLIWDVAGQLVAAGQPSHYIAVRAEIERLGRLRDIGNGRLIDDLASLNIPAGSAGYFAEKIAKKARAYRARTFSIRLRQAADDPEADSEIFDKLLAEYTAYEDQRAQGGHSPTGRIDALIAEMLDSQALDDMPALEPLVGDLLHLDTLARVIGPSGHMKSFAVIDFAGHIGTGQPWHGHPVKQGLVIYLVAEGARGIRKRVRAWEQHYGRRMEGVLFLPRPVQAMDPEWLTLIEAGRRLRPAMIVVDTQARVSVGVEENSAKELGLVVDRMEQLRAATGACVLLIHHTGHVGEHGRGSTSAKGALQSELHVSKKGDRAANTIVTIRTGKQKDDEEGPDMEFGLQVVPIAGEAKSDGTPVTSVVLVSLDRVGMPPIPGSVEFVVAALDKLGVPEEYGREKLRTECAKHVISARTDTLTQVAAIRKGRKVQNTTNHLTPNLTQGTWYVPDPIMGSGFQEPPGQTRPEGSGSGGVRCPPDLTRPTPHLGVGQVSETPRPEAPICNRCHTPYDPDWAKRGYDNHLICPAADESA